MKKLILIGLFLVMIAFVVFSQTDDMQQSPELSNIRLSKGVDCEVICNGGCAPAPDGWNLTENIGTSGGWSSNGAGGRCAWSVNENGWQYYPGVERMCCYFQN
ncbi:MAG: hypothetical protein ABIH25_05680 [Candidatus Woesearchaeota archaeon]